MGQVARLIEPARVLEQFCLLAGCSAAEAMRWAPLAQSCAGRLERRLREGADAAGNAAALALAAAGMLFYQYVMALGAGDGDVRLGEITIQNGAAGAEHARGLRDELLRNVEHLLVRGGAFLLQTGTGGCTR